MIRFCYWLNESHLLFKFVIFQETFQLIRKAVQDLTYKKKLHVWFVCLLSRAQYWDSNKHNLLKKFLFIFASFL